MKARDKKSPQFEHLDKDIVLKKMGARIKALRIKHGYTSYDYFAYDHNISCAQFGRYEKGQDLRVSSLTHNAGYLCSKVKKHRDNC